MQTAAQVQSISLLPPDPSISSRSSGYNLGIGNVDNTAKTGLSETKVSEPPLQHQLESVQDLSISANSFIKITTSVLIQRCGTACPCQCHAISRIRSPQWLNRVLGQMLITYHSGFLRTMTCNFPPCRRSPRKTEFNYIFPLWLVHKALFMSYVPSLSGPQGSIAVSMPTMLPGLDKIWSATRLGNIPLLQRMFSAGYTPYVIEEGGQNLIHVSNISSHSYHLLLWQYLDGNAIYTLPESLRKSSVRYFTGRGSYSAFD